MPKRRYEQREPTRGRATSADMRGRVASISSKECVKTLEELLKWVESEISNRKEGKMSLFCLISIKNEPQFRSSPTHRSSRKGRHAVQSLFLLLFIAPLPFTLADGTLPLYSTSYFFVIRAPIDLLSPRAFIGVHDHLN